MSERWLRAAQVVLIGAALIGGCNREGGPAPEVPALYSGNGGANGGIGGASGVGGEGGPAGEGGQGGEDSGGTGGMLAGGAGGVSGLGGMGGGGGVGGVGGMGGTGVSDSCTDSDATSAGSSVQPGGVEAVQLLTKGTTTGTNGTFHDACSGGDLREYVCETRFACGGQSGQSEGACAPTEQPTGMVIEVNAYCFGLCTDGVCYVPCPEADDALRVTQVEGASVELQMSPGIDFACTRDFCLAAPPSIGDELMVVSSSVPNELQPDCSLPFGSALEPLALSDGCNYIDCMPMQVIEP